MNIRIWKYLLIILILLLSSCDGDNENNNKSNSNFNLSPPPETDQLIAMRSICMGCHQMTIKTRGPSIKDISKKYKPSDIKRLVETVREGSTGENLIWGTQPMPPSYLSEEDIKKVIEWMLAQ